MLYGDIDVPSDNQRLVARYFRVNDPESIAAQDHESMRAHTLAQGYGDSIMTIPYLICGTFKNNTFLTHLSKIFVNLTDLADKAIPTLYVCKCNYLPSIRPLPG